VGGIRDEGKLDAALNSPHQKFHDDKPSISELATIYASAIVRSHRFSDGYKRTGLMAATLFIESNGYRFQASE
jgi:death on curing protein